MWTSERSRNLPVREAAAELGTVTLGGDPAGVSLGGERRWLTVYSPGGYSWRPTAGDRVMVLEAGAEEESPCIMGTVQNGRELKAGEVRLTGGVCEIMLGQDGLRLTNERGGLELTEDRTELTGEVYINGKTLRSLIREIVISLLG